MVLKKIIQKNQIRIIFWPVEGVLLEKYKELYNELQGITIYDDYNTIEQYSFLSDIPGESIVTPILNKGDELNKRVKAKKNTFDTFNCYIPKPLQLKLEEVIRVSYEDVLFAAYPMLQAVNEYKINSNKNVIIDYVKGIINAQSRANGNQQSSSNTF